VFILCDAAGAEPAGLCCSTCHAVQLSFRSSKQASKPTRGGGRARVQQLPACKHSWAADSRGRLFSCQQRPSNCTAQNVFLAFMTAAKGRPAKAFAISCGTAAQGNCSNNPLSCGKGSAHQMAPRTTRHRHDHCVELDRLPHSPCSSERMVTRLAGSWAAAALPILPRAQVGGPARLVGCRSGD